MTAAAPSNDASKPKPFLAALGGAAQKTPPIWLMRQAGRYLPEYRAIRAEAPSFLDFCYNSKLATEATLQPIRRFGFDAAILFSDILVVPDALGQSVSFETGEGPRLEPIENAADFAALRDELDWARLAPVFETVERVKAKLPAKVALIGFCGAPWTVASYMIAGHGTPDQAPARLFAYRDPELFAALIDRLADVSAEYLTRQIARAPRRCRSSTRGRACCRRPNSSAGASSRSSAWWRGSARRRPRPPIIAFPRGAATQLAKFADVEGLAAIGLDTAVEPRAAAAMLPAAPRAARQSRPARAARGRARARRGRRRVLRASPAVRISSTSATASFPRRRSRMSSGWSRGCAGRTEARGKPMNAIWTRAAALAATVALVGPAAAQSITINGVARSVSLMRDMAAYCPDVIPAEAQKFADAFLEIGHKSYGEAKFDAELAAEMPRREQEVRAAGAAAWCATQRANQLGLGNSQIFRSP